MPELQRTAAALLGQRRDEIHQQHQAGQAAAVTVAALSDLADRVILDLYDKELEGETDAVRRQAVLVALGGYGRRELAPFSDLDLMILHEDPARNAVAGVAGRFFRRLWDLNCQVGHSLRSLDHAMAMAREDLTVRTALMESRPLAGSVELFDRFQARFWKEVGGRDVAGYIQRKIIERQQEIDHYGSTTHLLEPHLKRSKGGLRDLHLIGWIARARYKTGDWRTLAASGLFGTDEVERLLEARDFLWRIRIELHFGAARAQELLSFEEQMRIARAFGYHTRDGLLDVERFMQQYHRQTGLISGSARQFSERAVVRPPIARIVERLTARRVGHGLVRRGDQLAVAAAPAFDTPERALQVFQAAQDRRLRLDPDLHRALREAIECWPAAATERLTPDAARMFLAILDRPEHLSETLRLMRSVGLLGVILPEFARVQGLMQFNAYHKFTVDEHCLRAVGAAQAFLGRSGFVADTYRDMRRRALLHLALLLHDIGKGLGEDHSEVGRRIARSVAGRLFLADAETEQLERLVHQHLLMAHTAFRRDLADNKVIVTFAKVVGSPETLALLYLLTVADLDAVGPGMLTPWKEALLSELFVKTRELLTGETWVQPTEQRLAELLAAGLGCDLPEAWVREQLTFFPDGYLATAPRERLAGHLGQLAKLPEAQLVAHGVHDLCTGLTEYTVYAYDKPGLFCHAAGAITSCGLEIVSAQIWTRPDGSIVDIFQVLDPDHPDAPPAHRLQQVERRLLGVLGGGLAVEAALASGERFEAERRQTPLAAPTRVEIDNDTSDRRTIIDVFAHNQRGLLYAITQALFQLGLNVHGARISTHLDQAVDVFYVTDTEGRKITEPERIKPLRAEIVAAIDRFLESTQARSGA